jgi:septum site-determining protein MinD
VLDADFGLRNLDLLLGLENRIVYTAQEVLAETCRLEQALVKHKQEPNLSLLPAGNPRMLEWLKPDDMKKIVAMVAERADFVLIDCPAGIEDGFKNAAAAAKRSDRDHHPGGVRRAGRRSGDRPAQQPGDRTGATGAQPGAAPDDGQPGDAERGGRDRHPGPALLGLVQEDEQVIVSTNRGEPLTLNGTASPAALATMNIARTAEWRGGAPDRSLQAAAGAAGPAGADHEHEDLLKAMGVIDVIQRLLGLQPPSASTANQRLRLVLAHDRSDLNPELLEQMRREILEVVQRYVEIDLEAGDVNLATEDQVTALVANLPIRRALPRPLQPPQNGDGGRDGDGGLAAEVASAREPACEGDGAAEATTQRSGPTVRIGGFQTGSRSGLSRTAIRETLHPDQGRERWRQPRLPPMTQAPLAPITPAEQRVLALLLGGESNRAIAEQLVLSPRTVESHVSSLLSKTGSGTAPSCCSGPWGGDKLTAMPA